MNDDRPPQPEDFPPGTGSTGSASAAQPPPLTAFAWQNGLVRPIQGRLLAGVCGALARATNTDPVLWRVIIGVLTIFGGFGVLVYVLGWLLLPADADTAAPVEALLGRGQSATSNVLTIIVGIVALIAVSAFVSEPFRPGILGAVLLGAAALLLLRDQRGRSRPNTAAPMAAPVAEPAAGNAPTTPPGVDTSSPAYAAPQPPYPTQPHPAPPYQPQPPYGAPIYGGPQPPFAPRGPFASGGLPPQPPSGRRPPRPLAPRPRRPRSKLGRLTFSLALIVIGILIAIDLAVRPLPTNAYLAAGLSVVALGLIIGAWFGRARGLIALGIILSIALTSVAGVSRLDQGWRGGTITYAPTSVRQVERDYRDDTGDVRLDLTKVDFASEPGPVNLDSRVDIGSLTILVPPNVDVVVDAKVDVGNADVLGRNWGGLGLDARTVEDNGADGVGGGTLHIAARVDLGNLEVSR
jgi:phage shock protein PspC (stress-responsive transcriptional regulator)